MPLCKLQVTVGVCHPMFYGSPNVLSAVYRTFSGYYWGYREEVCVTMVIAPTILYPIHPALLRYESGDVSECVPFMTDL
jgi:hypothetical protein